MSIIKYESHELNPYKPEELCRLVQRELVDNLFNQSPMTVFVSIIVGSILYFSLSFYIESNTPAYWFLTLVLLNTVRLLHIFIWRGEALHQNSIHLKLMLMGSFLAGFIWAGLLLFYSPSLPLSLQLFIMITLVGMPAGSLSTNSNYFPAFIAFSVPQLIGLLFWSVLMAPNLTLEFALLGLTYSVLLISTAFKLNKYLKESIKISIMNRALAKELDDANSDLKELAYIDALTGIHNRRYFIEKASAKLSEKANELENHYLFLLFDLDKFKQINDTLGHHAGDLYLKQIAERISDFSKRKDQAICARLGGDEFIISYRYENKDSINQDLQQLLDLITKPVLVENDVIEPSTSIGVAEFPYQGKDITTLLRMADKAMYRAKQNGGNQFYLCTSLFENEDSITRQ